MKLRASLAIYKEWVVNKSMFVTIKQKYCPITNRPDWIHLNFDDALNSPEYRSCMELLKQAGLKRMTQGHMFKYFNTQPELLKGYFCLDIFRQFTPKECATSEMVRLSPESRFSAGTWEPHGQITFDLDRFWNEGGMDLHEKLRRGHLPLLEVKQSGLVVSSQARRLFESSGLTGWRITRPVHFIGDGADDANGKYWHLEVPVAVPHSLQMRWSGADGEHHGAWARGSVVPDDGRLVFDRAVWEHAGCPDMVSLHYDLPDDKDNRLSFYLVSHRCFEFCKANKFKCSWEPVDFR